MKKLVLIFALVVGTISFLQAQTTDSESRPARQQMDASSIIDSRIADLTTRLSLTASQVTQVRAIYEKTLGSQSSATNSESSSDQRHTEIMALLNANQKEIYTAYLEERSQPTEGTRTTGRQMNSSGMIDSRVEDLTTRLSLTASQVSQVRAIYEKTMGSTSSTSETAGQTPSSSEQRHTEIMALLNADQKKIYEAYLAERDQ